MWIIRYYSKVGLLLLLMTAASRTALAQAEDTYKQHVDLAVQMFQRQYFEPALQEFQKVGSSRVDLQACKLEYSIVSPK